MTLDSYTKGTWLPYGELTDDELGAAGHSLFDGPFTWPVMVARRSVLIANVATMAEYTRRHGVLFAPHGKTTMSPELFAEQLDAGAWGITVATANQALAAHRFRVPRILLANEVLDEKVLRWAATRPDFLFYVDSRAGVDVAARSLAAVPGGKLSVLVELGRPGGRTGCRSVAQAVDLARVAAAVPGLSVAGVAGYEGGLPDTEAVGAWMRELVAVADEIAELVPGTPIVSAGGSAWFDAVVDVLAPEGKPLADRQIVLRSGAYISHDDGYYSRVTPFARHPEEGSLVGALEVWAQVISAPEPGFAVLGAGRRDVPFDIDLPVPLRVRALDGTVRDAGAARVVKLDDQHAYVDLNDTVLAPGELVCLGVSHPCTAFDKWRAVPVVDDEHRVVDVLNTHF
ncbi:alanine racemase [Streptomyces sp. SID3343]|uniref:alanine racemase n=1 Tax=Streptomyces sp. SID3343 TaxID=2690260 RepID=UPI001368A33A|nr:alanine racemase [Streptomyces sp. SID3343]MYW06569.1 alanine racemase [Streptomyces sp. SID3343]